MRTSKFFKTGLLLFVASLGLISCGDDDKEPEIVVDPVSENVEYYIEGKVVADNAALDGVSVTAGEATATTDENGQYSLTVKDKKTYTVSFAKKGYRTVSDASVEIANNATNRSLVTLNVTMSKEGVAVAVDYRKRRRGNRRCPDRLDYSRRCRINCYRCNSYSVFGSCCNRCDSGQ